MARSTRLSNFRLTDPNYLASQRIMGLQDDPRAGGLGVVSKIARALMARDSEQKSKEAFDTQETARTDLLKRIVPMLSDREVMVDNMTPNLGATPEYKTVPADVSGAIELAMGNPQTSDLGMNLLTTKLANEQATKLVKQKAIADAQQYRNREAFKYRLNNPYATDNPFAPQPSAPSTLQPTRGKDTQRPTARRDTKTGSYILSDGQKMLDKTFAKNHVDTLIGANFDTQKQLQQLGVVKNRLEERIKAQKEGTGGYFDDITGTRQLTPDVARRVAFPKSFDTQNLIEEVVQRNLRIILGAQFTEKEGVRLIARAYDPALDESRNLPSVQRLFDSMKKALEAKKAASVYFQQHNTLQGYRGPKVTTLNDIRLGENTFSGTGATKDTTTSEKKTTGTTKNTTTSDKNTTGMKREDALKWVQDPANADSEDLPAIKKILGLE